MVQIFAYFEHVQTVRKLEPMKNFPQDYDITRFILAKQLAPDVPVNMVATVYHSLDGERNMHHESNSQSSPVCVPRTMA